MIVGLAGIIAGNQGGYPAYGTLLSQYCTQTTITDAKGTEFTGYYNQHSVYADGVGGTYSSDSTGGGNCYYPYGFYFNFSQYSFDVSWTGCSNSGSFSMAGTWEYSLMADGSGGTISTDQPISWNYSNGYYIYDNSVDCRVVLDTSMSPWYYTESYGTNPDPYGTKIGTPYWGNIDGTDMVVQNIADGMGGVITISWDNNPPYPTNGTQIASPSYGCGYVSDAINATWYLCSYTYTYADGSGGSYTTSVVDGYYPSGYATSGYQIFADEYDTSWSIWDNNYNYVYPWKYGYPIADGMGGSSRTYSYPTYYGIPMSDYFYDQYNNYGRIYSDSNGGFFFS
jgi:hypothetical protein